LNISAIISDYDGTLCPMHSVRTSENKIPADLYQTLLSISNKIPVCILSSKDYFFLKDKVDFASIISCVNGIENFIRIKENNNPLSTEMEEGRSTQTLNNFNYNCVLDKKQITENSLVFNNIVKEIKNTFRDLLVEEKHCYAKGEILGITVDYRNQLKWDIYKENIEPKILRIVQKHTELSSSPYKSKIFVQTYDHHPFVDIYTSDHNKGQALFKIKEMLNLDSGDKVLYLGDSENDNTAFRNTDLGISIHSSEKLNIKLASHYTLEFNELRPFLNDLENKDFYFSRMNDIVI